MSRIIIVLCSLFILGFFYKNNIQAQNISNKNDVGELNQHLKVGAGKAAIRIPKSIFPIEGFTGIHDSLYTKTLIVENNTYKLAIVVIDLTSIFDDKIEQVRNIVTELYPMDPGNVIVIAGHTFSAPHVRGGNSSEDENDKNSFFGKAIDNSVRKSVQIAVGGLQPAKVGFGQGQSNVNVNRDIETVSGWWHGHNEHGISDKEVSVVRFESLEGLPIAILINYAVQSSVMDASIMDAGGKLVTPDLGGATCRYVGKQYANGCIAFFLTGAAGDQKPYFTSNRYVVNKDGSYEQKDSHDSGYQFLDILGEYLGSEALRVSEEVKKTNGTVPIKIINSSVQLTGQKRPPGISEMKPSRSYDFQEDGLSSAPFTIIQIDDIVLVGVQVELNALTGMKIKERSPFKNTMVVTMVNGAAKYMADEASFDLITYEAMSSKYAKGSAEILTDKVIATLNKLYQKE